MANERFMASPEMVDSIKLEISPLTAEEDLGVQILTTSIADFFITRYGRYLTAERMDILSTASDRVIVYGERDLNVALEAWTHSAIYFNIAGFFTDSGQLIFVQKPGFHWEAIPPKDQLTIADKYFLSFDLAKNTISSIGFVNTLAHELGHNLHAQDLPDWFVEYGTCYFEREAEQELGLGRLESATKDSRADLYGELLFKFGDYVHKAFFGQRMPDVVKETILANVLKMEKAALAPHSVINN